MKLIMAFLSVLVMVSLVFLLSGCKPSVAVDKDGNVEVKDDDGDYEIKKAKWDGEKMHGLGSPEAKIDSYVSADGTVMYTFSEMKEQDAKDYIDKIKDAGFTYNTLVISDYSFTGTNKDGKIINFTYDKESGGGTIVATQGDKPSEDENGDGAVVGDTDKKWDSSKMGGLPDPGTKIATYWSVDGDTCYTFEALEDYQDYLEKIKACGFTVDSSEVEINDTFIYSASNSNGDKISFTSSSDVGSVTFEKGE